MKGIALALCVCVGCVEDSGSTPPPTGTIRYRQHIQPIWDQWCTRCHNFHTPHLVADRSAEELAGVSWFKCDGGIEKARFVVPGDTSKSYLLYRLTMENTNNYDVTRCGRAMPADQGGIDMPLVQLDPVAVATIRTWIEEGASFD